MQPETNCLVISIQCIVMYQSSIGPNARRGNAGQRLAGWYDISQLDRIVIVFHNYERHTDTRTEREINRETEREGEIQSQRDGERDREKDREKENERKRDR